MSIGQIIKNRESTGKGCLCLCIRVCAPFALLIIGSDRLSLIIKGCGDTDCIRSPSGLTRKISKLLSELTNAKYANFSILKKKWE